MRLSLGGETQMPTFLHTADIHLDSPFSARFDTKRAELRRNELRRSVSDMFDLAKDVDLLLIAGDLFDGSCVSGETISFLKRKFSELPHTKIFIAAGNHDPFSPGSVYEREDFGDNVHVFSTQGECVEIPELKTRVYGVSFSSAVCEKTLEIPKIEKKDGYSDILLLHGDLVSLGGESNYNPIDKKLLENCGGDYVALGHIHKRSEVKRCGNTYYAYPGPPEGRGFDECGDMGCYIGSVDNGIADVQFKRVSRRRFFHVYADVSDAADSIHGAQIAMEEAEKLGTAEDLYKIILTGRATGLNIDSIQEELSARLYFAEVYNETKPEYDVEKLAEQNTLCGEFVRIMQKRISSLSGEEKAIARDAMLLGIEVLLGGDK